MISDSMDFIATIKIKIENDKKKERELKSKIR